MARQKRMRSREGGKRLLLVEGLRRGSFRGRFWRGFQATNHRNPALESKPAGRGVGIVLWPRHSLVIFAFFGILRKGTNECRAHIRATVDDRRSRRLSPAQRAQNLRNGGRRHGPLYKSHRTLALSEG